MKTVNRIAYLVIAILVYFLAVEPLVIEPILLNKSSAYTVAKIVGRESSVNGGPDYVFVFYVEGKKYRKLHSVDADKLNVGDCYRVKYYPENPKNCKIDIGHPVGCNGQ